MNNEIKLSLYMKNKSRVNSIFKFSSLSLVFSLAGCDPKIISAIKSNLQNETVEVVKNDPKCNQVEYRNLLMEQVEEATNDSPNLEQKKTELNAEFETISTIEKNEFRTLCAAKIKYTYPKEFQSNAFINIDIEYLISKNELKDTYMVSLVNPNLINLIVLKNNFYSKKEDYLFQKFSIKKITPSDTGKKVSFNDFQQSLRFNDWTGIDPTNNCIYSNENESTNCRYSFKKSNYLVTIITQRKDECFICSKKPELVISSHISDGT